MVPISGRYKMTPKGTRCREVYLDNAATTRVDPRVFKAMRPYMTQQYGNASSLYGLGRKAKEALEGARMVVASAINATGEEIVFTSGGSESNNTAIRGCLRQFPHKKHIITWASEHPSVSAVFRDMQAHEGYDVTSLKAGREGLVCVEDIKKAIRKDTVLISIMHANNEIGTIQPVELIGDLCKDKGIAFHSDCVQSFTKVKIDVKKFNFTFAAFSAHKIHGPKGVGALFVKKGAMCQPLIYGGGQESGKRAGTENIPGIVGFAKAIELTGPHYIKKMISLRDRLIAGLLVIPGAGLNGSREKRLCNNINVSFNGVKGESLLFCLDRDGIAVSTGAACSSKGPVSPSAVRFTLSRVTTEAEIDYTIHRVIDAVKTLRRISPIGSKYVH